MLHTLDSFQLESGAVLRQVPVAYQTWGTLNEAADNVLVICHALSGSADVEDWWGPLLGPGRAFDTSTYFIFCGNVLGSPYGTASPITVNPDTNQIYGPALPQITIRDDVRIHNTVLRQLGVKSVQCVIGGSMGGMQTLEWAFFGKDYVKTIIPIATSGRHSAWCISWGEAQRLAIYNDPLYADGLYSPERPPTAGLANARMQALLTYRSRNSFESRFGRTTMNPTARNAPAASSQTPSAGSENSTASPSQHQTKSTETTPSSNTMLGPNTVFSAQSYLRYQGDKFVKRFDANCYIAITRKMDTHDLSRDRGDYYDVLKSIEQQTLVIGIETDGLFTLNEQAELADHIPKAELVVIKSPDGHDGFLLEFEQMNGHISQFLSQFCTVVSPTVAQNGNPTPLERPADGNVEPHVPQDALMW
ncbi:homoserine acetyltransferase [Phlyctochytrium arcticum]|nr:homoserine acetyltransferase [Phlyctochytrium arcticum]